MTKKLRLLKIALIPLLIIFLLLIFVNSKNKNSFADNNTQKQTNHGLYNRVGYKDYSASNLTSSQKNGKTLLFFAATTWCSNCIALDKEIKERISDIPDDVTILKVDYDNDRKMKKEHRVAMQTTLILLDNNGNEEKRWIGTGSFDDLLENIN